MPNKLIAITAIPKDPCFFEDQNRLKRACDLLVATPLNFSVGPLISLHQNPPDMLQCFWSSSKHNQVMTSNNIFSTLFTYCTASEENYLTDAFAYFLRELLERTPNSGLTFLNHLCEFVEEHGFSDHKSITISTQVTVEQGRPDLEIKDVERIVYIEIKHDASLSPGQLEYYYDQLQKSDHPQKRLVLLTRSKASQQETALNPSKYYHICWYDVHYWLTNLNTGNTICQYLASNLVEFLEEKHMALNKVTWEYIQGVPALVNLGGIIEEATIIALPGTKTRRSAGWNWRGICTLDNNCFIGIRYDKPLIVVFENNFGTGATYARTLSLEDTHFFALTQGEQFEIITKFIIEARKYAPIINNPSVSSPQSNTE